MVWPPDDPSSAFTKEMALSVRLGAVALGLLMAEQLPDALQAVLGCRATDMDIARINRAAELIEKIVTSRES